MYERLLAQPMAWVWGGTIECNSVRPLFHRDFSKVFIKELTSGTQLWHSISVCLQLVDPLFFLHSSRRKWMGTRAVKLQMDTNSIIILPHTSLELYLDFSEVIWKHCEEKTKFILKIHYRKPYTFSFLDELFL